MSSAQRAAIAQVAFDLTIIDRITAPTALACTERRLQLSRSVDEGHDVADELLRVAQSDREAIAELRLVRMAVQHHRGHWIDPLPDPLGGPHIDAPDGGRQPRRDDSHAVGRRGRTSRRAANV